jgi:hypothetical protein
MVEEGTIARRNLYTIRKGEMVRDNVIEALVVAREEMIKIREQQERGCIYYDAAPKACTIYEERPAQCSAMACWEPARFMKVYQGPKLARRDAIKDPVLVGIIEAHESRCSYKAMEGHVRRIESEGDRAVECIIEILRFDHSLRPYISQKLGLDPKEMDFIFGRPMIDTIVMFGLKVEKKPDGCFYLTTLPGKNPGSCRENAP